MNKYKIKLEEMKNCYGIRYEENYWIGTNAMSGAGYYRDFFWVCDNLDCNLVCSIGNKKCKELCDSGEYAGIIETREERWLRKDKITTKKVKCKHKEQDHNDKFFDAYKQLCKIVNKIQLKNNLDKFLNE